MSFSITIPESSVEAFVENSEKQVHQYRETNSQNLNDGAERLIKAGTDVASSIVEGLAQEAETVNVTISGHGNPGTQPQEGYSNDGLSVSVWIATYRESGRPATEV